MSTSYSVSSSDLKAYKSAFENISLNGQSAEAWENVYQVSSRILSTLTKDHPSWNELSPKQEFVLDTMRNCNNSSFSPHSKKILNLLLDHVDLHYCGADALELLVYPSSVHNDNECLDRIVRLYYEDKTKEPHLDGVLADLFRVGKYPLIVEHIKHQTFFFKEFLQQGGIIDTLIHEMDHPLGGLSGVFSYPQNEEEEKLLVKSVLKHVCLERFLQPWSDNLLTTFISNICLAPTSFQDLFWNDLSTLGQDVLDEGLKAVMLKKQIKEHITPFHHSSLPMKKM